MAIGYRSGRGVAFHGIEPAVHGVNMGEVVGAWNEQARVLAGDEVLGAVAVLHQLQCLDEFLRRNLRGRCTVRQSQV